MSKLVKEYFHYQNDFEKKYGMNTIVLMQVGSFYEFYGLNTDNTTYEEVDANLNLDNTHLYTVSKLLGFSVAKKTNNVLMAGVPKYAIEKHIKKLLDNNYTIIIIEQIGDDKKDVDRKITNIYSPGTYLEDINSVHNNFLLSIYIENTPTLNGNMLEIGISCIDLSIGKNIIYEIPFKKEDPNYIIDELYRFVNSYNSKEIIVYFNDVEEKIQTEIISSLEIDERLVKQVNYDTKYRKLEVQEVMLNEIFKPSCMTSVFEYLNIERLQIGVYSYIHLLLFIKEHDNSKLLNLEIPTIYTNNEILNLNRNTIYRLNIIDSNQQENNTNVKSLFNVVDMTVTNIGKRTLKNRLLFPITNVDTLNKRYDLAEYFIHNNDTLNLFKNELKNISDIERLNRKLVTLKLNKESDLLNLYISLTYLQKIFTNIDTPLLNLLNIDETFIKDFNIFYNKITEIFNVNSLYNRSINIFNKGYDETIDKLDATYTRHTFIFQELCKNFTNMIKNEDKKQYEKEMKLVDFEWSDRDNSYNITTTEARSKKIKSYLVKNKKLNIKSKDYDLDLTLMNETLQYKNSSAGGKTKIKSDYINKLSDDLYKSKLALENSVNKKYKSVLEELYKYNDLLKLIITFIAEVDCAISTASNFLKYNYCKPILDQSNTKSYLDCKDIRHPIIERIINCLYVTNDICMGKGDLDGMLLFGTNSCGKSSLMKAIGLCVIMAQAGLYVPCSNMNLKPYTNIFSRIGNQDNIFTGKSSFTQEISELKDIFNRVNENSLVIGDEPCSGTEHISAIAIVSSSIDYLAKKKCSFIFATHLHKLNEITLLKDLDNLHMYHLKIKYDELTEKLIYDRKLEKGIGNEEYGLEVAKSLCLTKEFLNNAYVVKNQLKEIGLYSTKGSVYNSKKILHKCEICGDMGEEIHHIKFQNTANEFGHIESIHKDMKGNLCSICEKCHDKVHNDEIKINGYIQTSQGVELSYEIIQKEEHNIIKFKKKKYSEEDMKYIKELYETNRNLTLKQISSNFEMEFKRKISPTIVSKIIKDTY
jgi:DNA mismatch repair protein MutS